MSKKLYIGNLSYNIDDQSLGDLFAQCGEVQSVRIITDRESGRSKGFAFVEMSSDAEGLTAIDRLNGYEVAGRAMNVCEAKPQAPRDNNNRRGNGGGGGGGGGFRSRY